MKSTLSLLVQATTSKASVIRSPIEINVFNFFITSISLEMFFYNEIVINIEQNMESLQLTEGTEICTTVVIHSAMEIK